VLGVYVADADKAAVLLRKAMTEAFLETLPGAPTRQELRFDLGRAVALFPSEHAFLHALMPQSHIGLATEGC